jgi:hypothetical protein
MVDGSVSTMWNNASAPEMIVEAHQTFRRPSMGVASRKSGLVERRAAVTGPMPGTVNADRDCVQERNAAETEAAATCDR